MIRGHFLIVSHGASQLGLATVKSSDAKACQSGWWSFRLAMPPVDELGRPGAAFYRNITADPSSVSSPCWRNAFQPRRRADDDARRAGDVHTHRGSRVLLDGSAACGHQNAQGTHGGLRRPRANEVAVGRFANPWRNRRTTWNDIGSVIPGGSLTNGSTSSISIF